MLHDMGADVVKIEMPGGGDVARWIQISRDDRRAPYYYAINRGKRSVALDLRDEDDAELGRELARRADVMIENFKPGGLAKFGLDYASVSAANPGIVYASISWARPSAV